MSNKRQDKTTKDKANNKMSENRRQISTFPGTDGLNATQIVADKNTFTIKVQ